MFIFETGRKTDEKHLFKYIAIFCQHGLFPNLQLTYRQHHSRVTNEILKTVDSSNEVVLVLLDLSAAFDTLDRTLLTESLRLYLNFFRHSSAMVHIIILMRPFSQSNYW